MKRSVIHIGIILLVGVMATPSFSVMADDIVIDSGSDETVISRLPDAGEQEDFVCSDSTTGQLGDCGDVPELILRYYRVFDSITFDATPHPVGVSFSVSCDDGDIAVFAGFSLGQSPDLRIISSFINDFDPKTAIASVIGTYEGSRLTVSATCADYAPLYVP
jgi:hypothetical protein